jgi:hypothetical protein
MPSLRPARWGRADGPVVQFPATRSAIRRLGRAGTADLTIAAENC